MGVAVYWIFTCVLTGLETIFLVCGYETISILCIGLCWIVTVLGFGINGTRLSDYLKSNYPLEYQKMLESKKLSSQLKYRPKLKDPLLTKYQTAFIHYLRFVLFGIFAPFIVLILFI